MGRAIPPFYGEGIKYWNVELAKAIERDDSEAIQECLRVLATFIKNESKD